MHRAIAIVLLLVACSSPSKGAFTGFEDLTVDVEYIDGETFQSNGVSFSVVDLDFPGGTVRVFDGGGPFGSRSGGTGLELGYAGLGINFVLPQGAEHISTLFVVGSSIDLILNGVTVPKPGGIKLLDGTTIAGVSITVGPGGGEPNQGELLLDGPINSLVLAGSEVWIDNVTVIVPEPSSAALLLFAFLCGVGSLRHRSV